MSALYLHNLRLPDAPTRLAELRVEQGRFVDAFSADACPRELDLGGGLVLPGLIETHIHLDKACILERCNLRAGTLDEAIAETSAAKAGFTEADVYQRGARVLELAIAQGTMHMRTHVEIDPQIGLTGFNAVRRLQADYAWALDLQLCVFSRACSTIRAPRRCCARRWRRAPRCSAAAPIPTAIRMGRSAACSSWPWRTIAIWTSTWTSTSTPRA